MATAYEVLVDGEVWIRTATQERAAYFAAPFTGTDGRIAVVVAVEVEPVQAPALVCKAVKRGDRCKNTVTAVVHYGSRPQFDADKDAYSLPMCTLHTHKAVKSNACVPVDSRLNHKITSVQELS